MARKHTCIQRPGPEPIPNPPSAPSMIVGHSRRCSCVCDSSASNHLNPPARLCMWRLARAQPRNQAIQLLIQCETKAFVTNLSAEKCQSRAITSTRTRARNPIRSALSRQREDYPIPRRTKKQKHPCKTNRHSRWLQPMPLEKSEYPNAKPRSAQKKAHERFRVKRFRSSRSI
jgi:hypothetical protein